MQRKSLTGRDTVRRLGAALLIFLVLCLFTLDPYAFEVFSIREAFADSGTDIQLTVEDFRRDLQPSDEKGQTLVKGAKAVLLDNDTYKIESPEVILTMEQEPEEGSEEPLPPITITLTAQNAELDKRNRIIRMFDSVEAVGPDFEIHTESIRYDAPKRLFLSNDDVAMNRYEFSNGERALSISIRGRGLEVQLPMQKVTIGGDSTTTIYRVNELFLASESQENDLITGNGLQNVTIDAEGNTTYTHLLKKIRYQKNVRVRAPGRKLDADNLEITVEGAEESDSLAIRRIDASGNVVFEFDGHRAVGDNLEWRNFTQIGKMTGKPVQLIAGNVKITGNEIDFYRLGSRLRISGPGELDLMAPAANVEETDAGDDSPSSASFFSLHEPVNVRWKGSMVYVDGNEARFENEVIATQEDHRLKCDSLTLYFGNEAAELRSLHASKNVRHNHLAREIIADTLTWEADDGKITATAEKEDKWVRISEPGQSMKARTIYFLSKDNSLHSSGEGILILEERNGRSGEAPPTHMELNWADGMIWDGAGHATFRGSVKSSQPGRMLNSNRLEVFFDEMSNPVRLLATGNSTLIVEDAPAHPRTGDINGETDGEGRDPEESEDENDNQDAANAADNSVPVFAESRNGSTWQLSSDHIEGLLPEEKLLSASSGRLTLKREGLPDDIIEWSDNMLIDMEEMQAVFEGDVRADFSQTALQCGKLLIDLDEWRRLRYLNATEEVRFSAGENQWQLTADNASAVFAAGGELDHLIARNNVQVTDAQRKLKCQQLRLFFAYNHAKQKNDLHRATAQDDVHIWYEDADLALEARGQQMRWNSSDDRYELEGDPAVLSREGIDIGGEIIVIDRASGKVSLPKGTSPAETRVRQR